MGAQGPGRPPHFGSNFKKRTFERYQDPHHPYKSYFAKKDSYPKYHVDNVGYMDMDEQIRGFKMNQVQESFHHNGTNRLVHVPKNKCKQVFHKNNVSREIDFKVSQAIKKIAEDMTPKNNYMQVPLKMPVDTPLKIRTWKDSRELIIDPIIQQLHKQNNNLSYAKKVVDDVDEQNSEQINACDKVSEDLKNL